MTTPHEPSSDYIRFDEIEDVVASAELVAHLAPLLDAHPSYWKWVIVAAHNAMQGAMVCALADSTGTSVLDESAKKVLDWLNAGMPGDPPDENLASFRRLLNRCTSGPEPLLRLTPQQCQDITQLHDDLRNKFTHFLPHLSWSIPKADLSRIITTAMGAVESLMSRFPIETRVDGERQSERLNRALQDCEARFGCAP
jgi:hypothetical protein